LGVTGRNEFLILPSVISEGVVQYSTLQFSTVPTVLKTLLAYLKTNILALRRKQMHCDVVRSEVSNWKGVDKQIH